MEPRVKSMLATLRGWLGAMTGPRRLGAVQAALLVGLLAAHFGTRLHAHRATPLADRSFYPFVYRVSLSLMAGHGFKTYRFSDAAQTAPVAEFLSIGRERLSDDELRAFLAGPDAVPLAHPYTDLAGPFPRRTGDEHILAEPHYTTRVLDLYVTALVWKLFGVGWAPLFAFYGLVSTAACLMVFLIGRRLGGGFVPGFLASLFYLASPLEMCYTARSLRDTSPLWFAAFAFAGWLYLAGAFRSRLANLAAAFAVGVLATVGCGWRSDALLLAPFLLPCLVAGLALRGAGWRLSAAAGGAFVCGAVVTHASIGLLADEGPRMSPLNGFHIAYYGESARCEVLGVEDSCQVSRDDIQTCADAQHYRAVHEPGSQPVPYLGPGYGRACLGAYGEATRHSLYRLVSGFPAFYRACLHACRLEALPVVTDYYPAPPPPPPWMPAPVWGLLQTLNRYAIWLFVIGALAALLAGGRPFQSGALLLFSLYQACAVLLVLPEHKHAGPIVLPLSVFAGLGAFAVVRACVRLAVAPRGWREVWPTVKTRLRVGGIVALFLLAGWGVACGCARWYSAQVRAACLADVEALAPHGTPVPEAAKSPSFVRVEAPADPSYPPTGYLIRVRAGKGPARLTCRRVRLAHPLVAARLLVTHHDLSPGREQFFFLTCFQEAAVGDPRPLACAIRIEGDARVVECRRLDLSGWRHGPMSTVFYPGQRSPGNPRVHGPSNKTLYALPEEDDPSRWEP
jgi:hypothetical protein